MGAHVKQITSVAHFTWQEKETETERERERERERDRKTKKTQWHDAAHKKLLLVPLVQDNAAAAKTTAPGAIATSSPMVRTVPCSAPE